MNSSKSLQRVVILVLMIFATNAQQKLSAQLLLQDSVTAINLAQRLAGPGVTVSNAYFNSDCDSLLQAAYFNASATSLNIDSGIILTTGYTDINNAVNPFSGVNQPFSNLSSTSVPPIATSADIDLEDLILIPPGSSIDKDLHDRCALEFDFVPLGDSVSFEYIFASDEYNAYACTQYTDVFGFFISGPGIVGKKNLALVPGTNIPVMINTINAGLSITPWCTQYSPLSPFSSFFVTNTDTAIVYNGMTTNLLAKSSVQACSTYHLKLAIADLSDEIFDSGVFLRAGSLTSNAITFTPISSLNTPAPYIVEGCASGFIRVQRPLSAPFPYTVNYTLGGSATNVTDYAVNTLPAGSPPGEVTIPAGDSVAYIVLSALTDGLPEGIEEIKVYQMAQCGGGIVDSVSLFISDTIQMYIITPDTAICIEDSVFIQIAGDDSLQYTWTPATNISNPSVKEPVISPNITSTYVVCATLPASGCAPKCDSIVININQIPDVSIGGDTIVCRNQSIQLNPSITPLQPYTYTWTITPPGILSSTTILNPVATFPAVGNYTLILRADPAAAGCEGEDTMLVQVLPNDIILHNGDTVVCKGATVSINVTGHPLFSYNWVPAKYLNNPTLEDPISNPDTSITYTVTATYPGCNPMTKSFNIDVQPVPKIYAGIDRAMCNYDTVRLEVQVNPSSYPFYSYSWSPAIGLNNSTIPNPVFAGNVSTSFQVIVSTPLGCSDTDDVFVTVNTTEFEQVQPSDTTICPNTPVKLLSGGAGIRHVWTPNLYLNNDTIKNPIASPPFPIDYTLYATSPAGCIDTEIVRIYVASDALINLGDDVTLYPGESIPLYADGNCSFFTWFPNYHLSADNIKNPIANPPVTTQYYVTGTTEYGCASTDTITIRISPESLLDLPNAFSPSAGTSINDELRIIKRGLVTLNYFKIYNRWGQMVFDTKDIEKGWNGQFNGKPQPMGVYVYMLEAVTSTGKRINKQGNITLIR